MAEAELPIRPDGTLPIEIDTAMAKAAHPDQDHRYEITAEITDQSRRTIVGHGDRAGRAQALQRLYLGRSRPLPRGRHDRGGSPCADARPQAGRRQGDAQAAQDRLRRRAEAGRDARRELGPDARRRRSGPPDDQGIGPGPVPARRRRSTTATATSIEGGYLLTITGQGFDGASFRFNDLEIIPERKEYRPGETLRLLINTNQVNSTVLLFVRPTNGVYLPPKVVHLRGKSTVEEIGIVPRDMPNIFVEALTVADGKVHDEVREIAIPPESRVVDVAVEPSQKTYKPGQKAKVKVKLTGPDRKPFVGSTVVAVYDKAVEYISGGSNVPDIKEFFWKWKRSHHPQTESSLDRWSAQPDEAERDRHAGPGGLRRILERTDDRDDSAG